MINFIKGIFFHGNTCKKNFTVERYAGLTCVGYKCNRCGYEWYEQRSEKKVLPRGKG